MVVLFGENAGLLLLVVASGSSRVSGGSRVPLVEETHRRQIRGCC